MPTRICEAIPRSQFPISCHQECHCTSLAASTTWGWSTTWSEKNPSSFSNEVWRGPLTMTLDGWFCELPALSFQWWSAESESCSSCWCSCEHHCELCRGCLRSASCPARHGEVTSTFFWPLCEDLAHTTGRPIASLEELTPSSRQPKSGVQGSARGSLKLSSQRAACPVPAAQDHHLLTAGQHKYLAGSSSCSSCLIVSPEDSKHKRTAPPQMTPCCR